MGVQVHAWLMGGLWSQDGPLYHHRPDVLVPCWLDGPDSGYSMQVSTPMAPIIVVCASRLDLSTPRWGPPVGWDTAGVGLCRRFAPAIIEWLLSDILLVVITL